MIYVMNCGVGQVHSLNISVQFVLDALFYSSSPVILVRFLDISNGPSIWFLYQELFIFRY